MMPRKLLRDWQRKQDRREQVIRRAARHGHCYVCALRGKGVKPATRGQLCEDCFDAVEFPTPGVLP